MKLKDEITSDPLAIGYAGMTDQQVADSLNTASRTRLNPLSRNDAIRWLARHDGVDKLEKAASTGSQTSRSIAKAVLLLIQSETTLDVADEEIMGMIDQLVTGNVFTSAEKGDLVMLATETISRAQEIGLGRVNEGDIASARAS